MPRGIRVRIALALLALGCGSAPLAAALQPDDCLAGRRGESRTEARCYSLVQDGSKRTLRVYVPPGHATPLPVVLVLHGGGGTGGGMEWLTRRGFNRLADRDGAVVVYPDGIEHGWNDGRSANRSAAAAAVDDLAFLRALPRALAALHPVDSARVYVTGISNGGMMSYRLACDAAEVFAAAAPVAANMAVELAPACHPARAVPLLIMDGVEDPIMPWKGGTIRVLWMARGTVLSAEDSAARWLALDHCGALEPQPPIEAEPADGTAALPRLARCADDSEVRLYEIRGGGHTWPRGEPYLGAWIVGHVSHALDANETIWAFFRQHALH
ncbi:MAG TPA: PHB depolymerase family esterase [Steroidobacteraceae bacterium]|nr:PHB depolymerase family esterase [Steroidobacteraceae bacterium]